MTKFIGAPGRAGPGFSLDRRQLQPS